MKKITLKINNLNINNGIFQEDLISLILFCISLIHRSKELEYRPYGYKNVNHLLCIDDLKLFVNNDNDSGSTNHCEKI